MTTDIKELVQRLRDAGLAYGMGTLPLSAADALEAMAGEVERYREAHKGFMILQAALERVLGERRVAIAERDRLKAALVRLGTHTNISAGERLMIVQEALGGDA